MVLLSFSLTVRYLSTLICDGFVFCGCDDVFRGAFVAALDLLTRLFQQKILLGLCNCFRIQLSHSCTCMFCKVQVKIPYCAFRKKGLKIKEKRIKFKSN